MNSLLLGIFGWTKKKYEAPDIDILNLYDEEGNLIMGSKKDYPYEEW